jgi:hypothetical protein
LKKIIPVVLVLFVFIGCAHREHGDALIVRSGVLKQGIEMQAFLDVWGDPDKTRVVTFLRVRFSPSYPVIQLCSMRCLS